MSKNPSNLRLSLIEIGRLQPYSGNARLHCDAQVQELVLSIRTFGWTNPILADMSQGGAVIAGHGRLEAAKRIYDAGGTISLPNGDVIQAPYIPVIDCAGWPDHKRRAYNHCRQQAGVKCRMGYDAAGRRAE